MRFLPFLSPLFGVDFLALLRSVVGFITTCMERCAKLSAFRLAKQTIPLSVDSQSNVFIFSNFKLYLEDEELHD